ncbi:hypothetical protein [Metaclostridioides mangenotii]|uniref:hypothetical protein n=1 Tax=Metaclostridioides mangenotii TaxID=1540 RepID=UPI0004885DDC|nr:hypothetical protein [Clostridioides mangenotii]
MDVADQIIKVIDSLASKFGIAVTNNQEMLERLYTNIIKYETYSSIFWLVVTVPIIIAILVLAYKVIKKEEDYFDKLMLSILVLILLLVPVGVFSFSVDNLIKINVFPEQVVMEYVSDYLK